MLFAYTGHTDNSFSQSLVRNLFFRFFVNKKRFWLQGEIQFFFIIRNKTRKKTGGGWWVVGSFFFGLHMKKKKKKKMNERVTPEAFFLFKRQK